MQQGFMPIPQEEYVESYRYSPIHVELEGPDPPTHEEILTQGYLSNIRSATDQEKGGGYDSYLACQRAMLDAVCGLFYVPDTFGGGSSKNQT
ncbi:hypothetical protein FSP39_011883 [Pinctada imbricata]|uniref:MAT1 C-terminal CAK anchor domain-containing protein n=1 Tax=Pinctada imbricata TaxID=66713 RepID=A0AA88XWD5_PINIB|nr:hypothetical protein FSP39_011883 [Pinctada imbricata]